MRREKFGHRRNKEKIIVSLTSYPKRIHMVHKVIHNLFQQTVQADAIMLCLAEDDFPQKEKDLPEELLEQKKQGLSILWCEDLKPHNKYYFAMQMYPDDLLITVDDDIYYDQYLIEELINSYEKFPYAVSARRVHYITFESNGEIKPYEEWFGECTHIKGIPSMNLFATGVGGVLYPPKCMHPEIFHKEHIISYALYVDDIWLKFVQILNNTPVVWAETGRKDTFMSEGIAGGLYIHNVRYGGNDMAIRLLEKEYGDKVSIKAEEELYKQYFLIPRTELVNKLKLEKEILIFGAGKTACTFLGYMQVNLPQIAINAFLVTEMKNNPEHIFDIPVIELKRFLPKNNCLIVVAVLEKFQNEITNVLDCNGYKNYCVLQKHILKVLLNDQE